MSVVRLVLGKTEGRRDSPIVAASVNLGERYHSDLETYLVGLLGFAHVAEASNSGQATRYRPSDTVLIGCKQSGAQWYWRPEPTVSSLTTSHLSSELFLERFSTVQPVLNAILPLGAIGPLLHNFGQALATNYFERNKPQIKSTFGGTANWPDVWNFARVVRNAMSHRGEINITDSGAAPVIWKNLSYSSRDNGHHILHTDLWPGDIFDLIQEMDTYLP